MDINLTEVIKENITKGPSYRANKKNLLDICKQLGIKNISQFWDVLIKSQRMYCSHNFWNHEYAPCLDGEGDHVAYGLDEISKAMEKEDITCHDVCEVCGSCAYINQIESRLIHYLCDMLDERGLSLDENS